MFDKQTKEIIGERIEISIQGSDPYTKTNLVRFKRIDPTINTRFEMFLTDEELISLRDAISNHVKETA